MVIAVVAQALTRCADHFFARSVDLVDAVADDQHDPRLRVRRAASSIASSKYGTLAK